MIEQGLVHAISCTGALMAHGLVSSIGLKHYKYNPKYNDTELARRKLNRVTDTLEPETNLDTVEEVIGKVIEQIDGKQAFSPTELNKLIGKHLAENYPNDRGILKSAYLHKRAGIRPGIRRFGVGQRHLHSQHQTAPPRQETDPDGSGARQQGVDSRGHRIQTLWDFFHRRRRAA